MSKLYLTIFLEADCNLLAQGIWWGGRVPDPVHRGGQAVSRAAERSEP